MIYPSIFWTIMCWIVQRKYFVSYYWKTYFVTKLL